METIVNGKQYVDFRMYFKEYSRLTLKLKETLEELGLDSHTIWYEQMAKEPIQIGLGIREAHLTEGEAAAFSTALATARWMLTCFIYNGWYIASPLTWPEENGPWPFGERHEQTAKTL